MPSLPETHARRKAKRDSAVPSVTLYDVLCGLGFTERERIPICTQYPGGRFGSQLYVVGDLAGWVPPQDRNVWFGANPVGRRVRSTQKGGEADITRVRTLFADLDVKPGKCVDKLGQARAVAAALARYVGVQPVALIRSGHGLQPLWRIGSPRGDSNVIDRDWERQAFRETWWRFGAVVQNVVRDVMWAPDGSQNSRTIDGVFNIDRVLRCPGSINWKNPDRPVPVRTRMLTNAGRVFMRDMVGLLDHDGVQPLKRTRAIEGGLPTTFGEATEWIEGQAGATADLEELHAFPPSQVLTACMDVTALTWAIGEGDGAHRTMIKKVQHAVYGAQEGRAGLVLALHNIGEAYLAVMEAREYGELPGDPRDEDTATREWQSAVRGAVARARSRTVRHVDGWGRRLVDSGPETEAAERAAIRWGVYAPVYRRYRR